MALRYGCKPAASGRDRTFGVRAARRRKTVICTAVVRIGRPARPEGTISAARENAPTMADTDVRDWLHGPDRRQVMTLHGIGTDREAMRGRVQERSLRG